MELELVIQHLLYTQNFITIPELGSLVTQYQSARIVKSDHVKFVPPSTHIAFNAQLRESEYDLTYYLTKNYGLTPEQSQQEVSQFVNQTKELLKQDKTISICGVGNLYVDTDNNLQFKQSSEATASIDSFGLTNFHVHAIPREDAFEKAVRSSIQKESVKKKVFKALFLAIPIIFALILIPNILHIPQSASVVNLFRSTQIELEKSSPHKPLPDMASAHFNDPEPSNQAYDTPLSDSKPAEHEPISAKQDIISDSIQPDENNSHESDITDSVTNDSFQDKVEENPQFYVIVGSFSSHKNAQKYVTQLQNQAYDAGIVERDNKIRVYISQYNTKDIALDNLKSVRSLSEFSGAWLYADV
ncbi:MAG: SPOR domain-containing protein [Bacteroidales bacterium]